MGQILNRRVRQIFLYCFTIFCFLNALYFYYTMKIIDSNLNYKVIKTDVSCYYSKEDDMLPSTDDPNFKIGQKSIFFHETSCRGGLTSMQSCAIESAARLHPNRQINILFSSPVSETMLTKSSLSRLLAFRNVRVARVHIKEYIKGSPIELFLEKLLSTSNYWMEHTSDILKILTLYKYGGIYLDTDGIIVRNLDGLTENFVVSEHNGNLGTTAIGFSTNAEGANITKAVMAYLNDNFDPTSWTGNVGNAIKTVLEQVCPEVTETYGRCFGVEVQPPQYFYPITYKEHLTYFTNGTIYNMEGPYMHHTWLSTAQHVHIHEDSPYARLANKFCPTTYHIYNKYWGKTLMEGKYEI